MPDRLNLPSASGGYSLRGIIHKDIGKGSGKPVPFSWDRPVIVGLGPIGFK